MAWLIGKQFPIASVMCENGVEAACSLLDSLPNISQEEGQKRFGELISNPTFRALGEGAYTDKNKNLSQVSAREVEGEFGSYSEQAYKEKMGLLPTMVKGRNQVKIGSINQRKGIKKMTETQIKDLSLKLGYNSPEIRDFTNRVRANARAKATMTDEGEWIEQNIPGGDVQARIKQDEQIIENFWQEQLNERPVQRNRQVVIVFGMPGAGKSSQVADNIIDEIGGVLIDADEFKDRIPEYQQDSSMVSAIHEESSWMTKKFTSKVIENGANAVYPMVGAQRDSALKKIQKFKNAGYNVTLVNANLPMEEAMDRNLSRFWQLTYEHQKNPAKKKPRIIHPSIYASNDNFQINETYEDLINNPDLVDSYAEVDIGGNMPIIGAKSDDFNYVLGKPFKDNPERAAFVKAKKEQYKVDMKRVR